MTLPSSLSKEIDTMVRLTQTLIIEPHELCCDIENIVIEKVNKQYNGFCNRKNGYFIKLNAVNILGNTIDRVSANILMRIEVDFENFLPEEGMVLEGTVLRVIQGGLICKVKDCLNILIPMATLPGSKFDKTADGESITLKNKTVIKKDQTIRLSLQNLKYEKHKYTAIGKLEQ